MSNQRAKNKIRVTVPMERELEREIKRVAVENKTNRVEIIKEACRKHLSQIKKTGRTGSSS